MAAGKPTDKQRAFVDFYFACGFNATLAAKMAGYSEATAAQQGYQLLHNPSVRALIDERFDSLASDAEQMRRLLVRELVSILSSDLTGVVDWDDKGMRLVPSAELSPEQASSLKEVSMVIHKYEWEHEHRPSVHQLERSKVSQHDKVRAADLLARLHGLLRDRVDVKLSGGISVERLHELADALDGDD